MGAISVLSLIVKREVHIYW